MNVVAPGRPAPAVSKPERRGLRAFFEGEFSARKVAAFLKTVVAQEQEKSNAHA